MDSNEQQPPPVREGAVAKDDPGGHQESAHVLKPMPRFLKEPCSRVKGKGRRVKWTDPELRAKCEAVLYRDRLEPLPFDPIDGIDAWCRDEEDAENAAELAFIVANNKAGLSNIEAAVIHCRFGLIQERPMTLEQVGQIIGVTKGRVHQIQNRALEKIRAELEARL